MRPALACIPLALVLAAASLACSSTSEFGYGGTGGGPGGAAGAAAAGGTAGGPAGAAGEGTDGAAAAGGGGPAGAGGDTDGAGGAGGDTDGGAGAGGAGTGGGGGSDASAGSGGGPGGGAGADAGADDAAPEPCPLGCSADAKSVVDCAQKLVQACLAGEKCKAGACASCPLACSPDKTSVVDCDGVPVQSCGPKEQCAGGACKDACVAANETKASVGCIYYAVNMEGIGGATGGCFTAFVANTWPVAAKITVTFAGQPIDLSKFAKIPQGSGQTLTYGPFDPVAGLAAGQVAIVFLAHSGGVACPVPAAISSGAQVMGTGLGKAFRIQSDVPVAAYQMLPYGGGSAAVTGASLLLPTSAWDKNYVAMNAFTKSTAANTSPSMDIVAAEDGTNVTIKPKTNILGGSGVAPAPANVATTYALAAGQVLQITQPEELTGSPILADKPVGLWAGHACLNVPASTPYCDHAEQQIPPVRALASEYVGVSYRPRAPPKPENALWRIVGVVDGTQLAYDPVVPGAPATTNLGQVSPFNSDVPFVVKSQDEKHPFILVTYMSGSTAVQSGYGDADFVRIVPPGQYLGRYVFFTDPTYPETNLVVVRKKGPNGFADVTLDCAGKLAGWAPVGAGATYEYARTDLVRHNFQPQGGCNNGRHEMTSPGVFGLWVWGWGTPETTTFTENVSYGYPAGENVEAINSVTVGTK